MLALSPFVDLMGGRQQDHQSHVHLGIEIQHQ